ncbi:GNAT family N-acetyltransferase [Marinoscillum furvescens]|uniref:RimJ/RimL family protein N-acetyltransferase n=1 Tax=Marinoscillum furvescens DSM 4134 TaxID=1122208 RepID=A0A3D9L6U4_MARFU|nr:GNAT family protein [Marinoscillum furvescens]REE01601.1 RimJ/RimL family protein N-acetyltransferase [Marinoscillum furvescens DSM 4134]
MLPFTKLENEVLLLTPLELGEWKLLAHLAKDQSLWEFFPYDLSEEAAFASWMDSRLDLRSQGKWLTYKIFHKVREEYVGVSSYLNIDEPNKVVEIGGTWYGAAFHGSEVNPNSKLLLMTHAFETLGFERVEFKTDARNVRSRRAIAKLGAKEEGTLRSNRIVKAGRRRDTVYYSVLKYEWPAVKAGLMERVSSYK